MTGASERAGLIPCPFALAKGFNSVLFGVGLLPRWETLGGV
jgi:hypothetical protein